MKAIRVKLSPDPSMTVRRDRTWSKKMVYAIVADRRVRHHTERRHRSRLVYIGTTKKGAERPASSAAKKAMQAFEDLRGVKSVDVRLLTCKKRQSVPTWEYLESALLVVHKHLFRCLPYFNRKLEHHFRDIRDVEPYFKERRLRAVLDDLGA